MADFRRQTASILAQLEATPGLERLRALAPDALQRDLLQEIVEAAARFAAEQLAPLDPVLDREGAKLVEGRVRTAPGYRRVWDQFVAAGWPTLDHPVELGGQGLPNLVATMCEELFTRASPAFGMLATPTRAAAKLLIDHAKGDATDEWVRRLVSGEWGGTICISEPDAGSDVGRIRTLATPDGDGGWRVSGEKMWISFGDHDLTPRIGHMLLARTPDAPPGTRGLSLFLVPVDADDARDRRVRVRRLEEKLGLHGSPTCALGFEEAPAILIGQPGRGLSQLFRMITVMRLSVAAQGLGLATGAAELAFDYAAERREGGAADAPALPIARHPDVQRQLFAAAARTEVLRGLLYAATVAADLAEREPDPASRADAAALLGWLLPIAKNFGAETGFDVPAAAVLLFGGAGYTREWPIERALRDARVFAIYEGTTGMQALDLLQRRLWRGGGRGLDLFLEAAGADLARADGVEADRLHAVLASVAEARDVLEAREGAPVEGEACAVAWLDLCTLAVAGWIALRLSMLDPADPTRLRLAACGRFWLADLPERASVALAAIRIGAARLREFDALSS